MFDSMCCVSLNVRGIRESVKRKALFLFCKRSEADFIMLQETHSLEEDGKFWKVQWGNSIYYSHGSNHSAGVAILFHKFKGDVLEVIHSVEGRWILLVAKHDDTTTIIGNIYGYNCSRLNKLLFAEISCKTKLLSDKYTGSTIILGGDFNECMDGTIDRFPPRLNQNSTSNNIILNLTSDLSLSDAWRFFNPDFIDFTWFNNTLTLKSRIDLFLISQSALSSVIDVKHSPAPLTDHKLVTLKLGQQHNKPGIRGYWKFNNSLLNDEEFNDGIKGLVKEIFTDCNDGYKQKWEFFKYKARLIATKRCRVIKARRNKLETELMQHLNRLTKTNNTEEEKLEIKKN